MKCAPLLSCAVLLMQFVGGASSEPCRHQTSFDITMCTSFMCTECTQQWCADKCQKVQADNPTCRCSQWPSSQTSYSAGDFIGKGKYGDVGEYGTGPAWSGPSTVPPAVLP